MSDFLLFISEILWESAMLYLLAGAGLWFSWRTRFIQFRYLRYFPRALSRSLRPSGSGLTAFEALCTSIAARVGSGNIAGVAFAIISGGPGAVFWMWVAGLIGMATSFAENALGQLYKGRDRDGYFRGGPAWYMERGLGMRWMGVLFSLFLIFTFGLLFNAAQAGALSKALSNALSLPAFASSSLLALCLLPMLMLGFNRVARLMRFAVPPIAGIWVITALVVMVMHISALPEILWLIVRSAFGWHEAASGAVAWTISQALTCGFQRGMFSNEAGMGASPNAAAAATSWPPHPAAQGIVQMIGVFVDTLVICSSTAFIVLLANPSPAATDGLTLARESLGLLAGYWAKDLVAGVIVLFAFISIVANYAYAENNLVFLRRYTPPYRWLLRIAVMGMVFAGPFLNLSLLRQVAEVAMALMAVMNLTAILLLSPVVKCIADDYLRQRRLGLKPVFNSDRYPEIARQVEPEVWRSAPLE
ncbi:alanine/glycine:cation symporter family protein [Cronobacter turicensis]|uniref:alanine/glycine:cation symporter family protein n=1 Tax=Cronobacter turicensis TaxID=413502 RepID=UPI000CFD64C3|nr:sodium:alanine symporter family protein [Cronobacter turicensis]ELQ6150466.1 sodium:alanine symporter family protein [Cronobacter turicensis]ELQ6270473.1 sodium:alanine symporter family protein [Cronobacter turicensis]ELY4609665.1 sodium:alanine symporter family protein [Cronobacter turicensis]